MPKVSTTKGRKPDTTKNLKKKGTSKKIPRSKKRPEWDSTSNDLNVHKLSKVEVERRHKVHQSKNIEAAKHELYDKAKENFDLDNSDLMSPSISASTVTISTNSKRTTEAKRLLALQRSLHGRELHDVLLKSDRTMRVVKDLFGDDPKRYSCQPNVTVAPHVRDNKESLEQAISESQLGGPPPTAHASPGGIRDKSVRDMVPKKLALNDLPEDLDSDEEATSSKPPQQSTVTGPAAAEGASFKSAVDLKRFQQLVQERKNPPAPKQNQPRVPSVQNRELKGVDERRQSVISDSFTDVSELSSIPVHPDLAMQRGHDGNLTVDSEASSVYNLARNASTNPQQGVVMSQQVSRPPPTRDNVNQVGVANQRPPLHPQQQAVTHQGGVASQRPPLPTQQGAKSGHPLQRSQKMSLQQQRPHPQGGRGSSKEGGVAMETNDLPLFKKTGMIHADLAILEKLVRDLESELSLYERALSPSDSAPPPSTHPENLKEGGASWPEIMGSLLHAVRKMMQHLRQSELQLRGEVAIRGQFLQTLHEQQDLMDVLTADLLSVRKENEVLRHDVSLLRDATAQEMAGVKADLQAVVSKLFPKAQVSSSHPTTVVTGPVSKASPPNFSNQTSRAPPPPVPSSQPAAATSQQVITRAHKVSHTEPVGKESQGVVSEAYKTPAGQRIVSESAHAGPEGREGMVWSPPVSSMDNSHASTLVQRSLDETNSTLKTPSPRGTGAGQGEQRGVVYAQASPLSYNAQSRVYTQVTSDPRVSAGPVPITYTAKPHPPTAETAHSAFSKPQPQQATYQHADFLQTLNAPAPPPLSVALQVPPYSLAPPRPFLAPPRPSVAPPKPSVAPPRPSVAPPTSSQAPTSSLALSMPSVSPSLAPPSSMLQDAGGIRSSVAAAHSSTAQPGLHDPVLQPMLQSAAVTNGHQVATNPVNSAEPRAESASSQAQQNHQVGSEPHTTPPHLVNGDQFNHAGPPAATTATSRQHPGGMFDVGRLLDSLQQLTKTQDQLQATAHKLRSLPQQMMTDGANIGGDGGLESGDSPVFSHSQGVGDNHVGTADLSLSYVSSLPGEVTQTDSQLSPEGEGAGGRMLTRHSDVPGVTSRGGVNEIQKAGRTDRRRDASESSPAIVKRKVAFEKEHTEIPLIRTEETHTADILLEDPEGRGPGLEVPGEKRAVQQHSRDKTNNKRGNQTNWFALSSHLS